MYPKLSGLLILCSLENQMVELFHPQLCLISQNLHLPELMQNAWNGHFRFFIQMVEIETSHLKTFLDDMEQLHCEFYTSSNVFFPCDVIEIQANAGVLWKVWNAKADWWRVSNWKWKKCTFCTFRRFLWGHAKKAM